MKFQLKGIVCAVVMAAVSFGAVPVAYAAGLVANGYSWSYRSDGARRDVRFVCLDGKPTGWAQFDYSDGGYSRQLISSHVILKDGTVAMAGTITDHIDPNVIGWTGFFGVRDNDHNGKIADQVTFHLIAPPEYETAQDILDAIGGTIPEDRFLPIDGGNVKVF